MMKRKVIVLSFLGTVILYVLFNSRSTGLCEIYCGDAIDRYQNVFLFFPLILLFSLITYKTPQATFEKWWAFSRYAIPVVFVITILINSGIHHNPYGQLQNIFDLPIIISTYMLYILGSLIQIVRGYQQK
jgi:hypothetical protein